MNQKLEEIRARHKIAMQKKMAFGMIDPGRTQAIEDIDFLLNLLAPSQFYVQGDRTEFLKVSLQATQLRWQQSHFVDNIHTTHWSALAKRSADEREQRTVRGPGAIGSPQCNPLFVLEGAQATAENTAFIVWAANHRPLLVDLLDKEEEKL